MTSSDWDTALLSYKNHNIFQSEEWFSYFKAAFGIETIKFNNDLFLCGVQKGRNYSFSNRFGSMQKTFLSIATKIFRKNYFLYGPLLSDYSRLDEALGEIRKFGKIEASVVPAECQPRNFKSERWMTSVLNPQDTAIDKKARKAIKLAQENAITIEMSDDIEEYYRLLYGYRAEKGFVTQPKSSYYVLKKELGEHAKFFFGIKDGRKICAMSVYWVGDWMGEFGIGNTEEAKETCATYLLKNEVIEWGKKNGIKRYDLGGLDPKNKGIYQFKSKWGGIEMNYTRINSV